MPVSIYFSGVSSRGGSLSDDDSYAATPRAVPLLKVRRADDRRSKPEDVARDGQSRAFGLTSSAQVSRRSRRLAGDLASFPLCPAPEVA